MHGVHICRSTAHSKTRVARVENLEILDEPIEHLRSLQDGSKKVDCLDICIIVESMVLKLLGFCYGELRADLLQTAHEVVVASNFRAIPYNVNEELDLSAEKLQCI